MTDQTTTYPRMTLPRAVYSFVLLGMIAVGLIAVVMLNTRALILVNETLNRAVRLRTEGCGRKSRPQPSSGLEKPQIPGKQGRRKRCGDSHRSDGWDAR